MRSRVVAAVLAVVLVLAAFVIVGCGGGEEPETTAPTTAETPVTPPPPAEGGVTEATDLSPEEPSVYEAFPTDPAITPKAVLDLIESKQPMMVYFYDPSQKDTNDESQGIDGEGGLDQLMDDYRGAIDLVSFDIGRFVQTASDGTVVVDPALANDEAAKQAAALASELGVSFTPYVVIVDGEGYIIARFRGWDDWKDIEREVLRATS